MKIKKIPTPILAAVIAMGMLAGCASDSVSSSSGGSAATSDSPSATASSSAESSKAGDGKAVEISVMLFDRGNTPEGQGSITENRWTTYINEKMAERGVHVTFVTVPRSEEFTKIPVMMASGTAADVMIMYSSSLAAKFYTDGGTYDLAPYLSETPGLVDYLGEDVLAQGRNENGEQWGIPARRSTTARSNAFIRKDWLDTLGLDVPKTVDELYTALKAFKEQDPGGVGKDMIVCYQSNGNLLNSFLKNASSELESIIGSGFEVYTDEGYDEYIRFSNKLYNEGLMDPEYFTSKNFAQKERELFVSGFLGYWEYNVNGNITPTYGGLLQNLKQNIPEAEMISMLPVANVNDGKVYNSAHAKTGAFVFLPKTAKDPAACMRYLEFLSGEGGFAIYHGIEGEHFEYQDNIPIAIDSDYNAETKDWIRTDLFLIGNSGYFKTEDEFIASVAKQIPGWESYVESNYKNAMEGVVMPSIDYASPTQTDQSTNISKVMDDYKVRATTCKPEEVDAVLDEWRSELEKYDIQKILDERRAYFTPLFS